MKKKNFKIPGIYHDLVVHVVSKSTMTRKFPEFRGQNVLGVYDPAKEYIHLVEDVTEDILKHNLYHEISHYILDTLSRVESDEDKCDLLGAYIMRLGENKQVIENELITRKTKEKK